MNRLLGLLDRGFRGFITLRGLASLRYLKKISKADAGYQRNLIASSRNAIKDYFNAAEYTFFPEVILALEVPTGEMYAGERAKLYKIATKERVICKFDTFTIKTAPRKTKSQQDVIEFQNFCRGELTLLNQEPILSRIDGNHRLSVADEVEDRKIPFCIVFLGENSHKIQRVLFNNINFKTTPLTLEENLSLIFQQDSSGNNIFSDEELTHPVWFGQKYVQARSIYQSTRIENLEHIKSILLDGEEDKFVRTFMLELSDVYNQEINAEKLNFALEECNSLFEEFAGNQLGYQLLVAYCHYYLSSKIKFTMFHQWVRKNHIYKLDEVAAQGLIKVFDQILDAKHRKIFLAMSFASQAEQNYSAIRDAIKDLNRDLGACLQLELIRIDDTELGYSFSVVKEILRNIEQGGYLIADLTLCNPNVYYELGYQMGLNDGKNMPQENFLLVHNKEIANFEEDKIFNVAHMQIITANGSNDLRNRVKSQLEVYYGLNNE